MHPRHAIVQSALSAACLHAAIGLSTGCNAAQAADNSQASAADLAQVAHRTQSSLVLITLDGVRWQEIFHGVDAATAKSHGLRAEEQVRAAQLLPNLHRLMVQDGAALGAGPQTSLMQASGPSFVSLPGYTEIMTGRTDTGCEDNNCGRVHTTTVIDELSANGTHDAAVFSSWSSIGNAASKFVDSCATSVGRNAGQHRAALEVSPAVTAALADGERAQAFPGEGDFRPDDLTGEAALAYLHVARPRFLFIGLGETDEYAHQDDYRAYLNALRRADELIGRVATYMSREIALGHPTTVIVTTDHGRADSFTSHGSESPESSRVWLVAAGSGIQARGNVASGRTRHLADIAPTIRRLLGLPAVTGNASGQALTELLSVQPASLAAAASIVEEPRTDDI